MALEVFKLLGTIALDNSSAMSGMDDTVTKAKKTESNLSKIFKKVGTIVASAFAIDKIKEFGIACKDAYAEVAAEQSAFSQIMGDYVSEAQEKLDAVAAKTGTVATRMTPYMTSLTAKFKGLGYGVEDATDLAAQGLNMAADAAAFWDMSLEESTSHLNSFINGSYEGGEAIGLFANDTQMALYAVEQGIVADTKAWAALDEATKQATRLEYAQNMLDLSGATGQAAKESTSLANVTANLKEHWRQFLAVIGEPIVNNLVIPAMQKLNEIMPKVTEATKKGIEWIGNAFSTVKESVKNLPQLMASAGDTITDTWTNTIYPAIKNALKIVFGIELPEWSKLKAKVVDWWESDNGIKRGIASVCNWALNLFGAPANVTAQDVFDVLSSWWNGAKSLVQNVCNWVLQLFGAPSETAEQAAASLSTWWNDAQTEIQDTCDWILGLFDNPSETAKQAADALSTWWSGARTEIETACEWVLKLFGVPAETASEAADALATWWSNARTEIEKACEWVLKLFSNPAETASEAADALSTWWSGARAEIEKACEWVLKLFGIPTETASEAANKLSTWWSGARAEIEKACEWVLKLFSNPAETASEAATALTMWWNGVRAKIEETCTWVLQLPATDGIERLIAWLEEYITSGNAAKDVTTFLDNALSFLSGCIETVIDTVASIVGWMEEFIEWLNSGTLSADAFKAVVAGISAALFTVYAYIKAKSAWEGFKTAIDSAKTAFTALNTVMKLNKFGIVVSLVAGVVTGITTLWNTSDEFRAFWINAWEKIKEAVSGAWDGIKGFFDSIATAWNNITGSIQGAINAMAEYLGLDAAPTVTTTSTSNPATALSGGSSAASLSGGVMGAQAYAFGFDSALMDKIPGFATGLDYVPRDNYLARLHQGEAVLTREEADVWRGNGDTSRVEAALNNVASLLQTIAQNTGAGTQIVLDSGVLVGQLAPGLDAQLGTISSRKGRRN